MSTTQHGKPWDFSHVLDLVSALSPKETAETDQVDYLSSNPTDSNDVAKRDFAKGVSLGDFGRIWQALGVSETTTSDQNTFTSKDDYTSDGAVRYGLRSTDKKKRVTWKEETSADELVTEPECEHTPAPAGQSQPLSKAQRKKQSRRARKAREASSGQGTVSESEADTTWLTTPARKASTHAVSTTPPGGRYNLRSRSAAGSELATLSENNTRSTPTAQHTPTQHETPIKRPDTSMRQNSEPVKRPEGSQISTNYQPQWPVSAEQASNTIHFLPSSVPPKATPSTGPFKATANISHATAAAVKAVQTAQAALNQDQTPVRAPSNHLTATLPRRQLAIEPKIVRSGEDRNWALLLKLINEYPETRKYLVAPMNMTTHNNDPAGIHIFVDASNIFIGFNDQLKRARNIPSTARVPPVDLSFDALALLMERRRPVAKRELVGSTPHLPAFDKAKAVGYECSILEKVYKAKELTDRQIFFRDAERKHGKRARASLPSMSPSNCILSGTDDYSGVASGSETTTGPQFAPAKMIEQGVDEILHLKILESVVDSDRPSTMVIATGDAAQAEYSDGFMAMTLRALKKGWKVELVSWSKNISSMYLRQSFRDAWGEHFRVVFLDDYAEELLDM